jgi:protoporphyrinogen oxidase
MKNTTIIIGAGMTGLTAALRLAKAGRRVLVLESSATEGGLTSSIQVNNSTIEHLYHHCFASDHHLISLIAEMGLSERFSFYLPKNGLLRDSRLYPFTSPLDLLRFKPLPFLERIRTGLTVLKAKQVGKWLSLESENASDYLKAKSGKTAYDRLWRPLLTSKFGNDADDVSAVWIWNKFKLRGSSRAENISHESLGYLDGGFGLLTSLMADKIRELGSDIALSESVERLTIDKAGREDVYTVETNKRTLKTKSLIAAVSSPVFAQLSRDLPLPPDYAGKVSCAKYKANICLLASFSAQVTPFYWTTVCDELPFVVLVEHTNLVGTNAYGSHLLYLSRYLDEDDPLYTAGDSKTEQVFLDALYKIFPGAQNHFIETVSLTKNPYTQPVIPLHYSKIKAELKTPLPGLCLAGMSQIYPEDRGLNYAVRLGEEAAAEALSDPAL